MSRIDEIKKRAEIDPNFYREIGQGPKDYTSREDVIFLLHKLEKAKEVFTQIDGQCEGLAGRLASQALEELEE